MPEILWAAVQLLAEKHSLRRRPRRQRDRLITFLSDCGILDQRIDPALGSCSALLSLGRQETILEAFGPEGEDPRRSLPEHVHDLASGEFDHHHLFWVDGRFLMQVLLPVAGKDGVMHGSFEGVYVVNAGIVANSGRLRSARDVLESHHEKYGGSGYLKGLSGKAIHRNAKLFAIIEVFDALASRRP